jgi:hypothetical protein
MKPATTIAQLAKLAAAAPAPQPIKPSQPTPVPTPSAAQPVQTTQAVQPVQPPQAAQPRQKTDWASYQPPQVQQQNWTNPVNAPGLTQHQRNSMEQVLQNFYDQHRYEDGTRYTPSAAQMQQMFGGVTDRESAGKFLGPRTGFLLDENYGGGAPPWQTPEGQAQLGLGAGEIGVGLGNTRVGQAALSKVSPQAAAGFRGLGGPVMRASPWLAYLENPIDDQGNLGGAINAGYTGTKYLQGIGQGLQTARTGGGGLQAVLGGGRQALTRFNPVTNPAGRGLATRWAAPLYLGADAANELWHSTNEGYNMGATNPFQAFGYGFDARTGRTLDANGNIDGVGDYFSQVLDNSGRPLQMLYAAPKGILDTGVALGKSQIGNASLNRQGANLVDAWEHEDRLREKAREIAAEQGTAPPPRTWRDDYKKIQINAQLGGRKKVYRYQDRNTGQVYTTNELPESVRQQIYQ